MDNSLGAWWAAGRLGGSVLSKARSEDELRAKAAISGVPLKYLRFVKGEEMWAPASMPFAAWPDLLSELKIMDPCCGSGHFLVAILLMLVPMRMEMEDISPAQAIDRVLAENIHGLEIDNGPLMKLPVNYLNWCETTRIRLLSMNSNWVL